ncbi:MAG: histidine decarboxylase, pyruvoyl type [Candidatus Promineifilaceae bacterium]
MAPFRDSETEEVYLSQFPHWCQGAWRPNHYFLAYNVSAAKVRRMVGHASSTGLDEINAFDLAEIERMDLGQLNILRASSFCGPQGLIWGYDVAVSDQLRDRRITELQDESGRSVSVYDGESLIESAAALFGTVRQRRFPIAPGSLCPAAWKHVTAVRPGRLFATLAIGIPEERDHFACSLMEDVGTVSESVMASDSRWRQEIVGQTASSVLAIMANQGAACREVFVAMASVEVNEKEAGCALVMAPYFSLARQALPEGGIGHLRNMKTSEWLKAVSQ